MSANANVVELRGSMLGRPLSGRERQILALMCAGYKLKQIHKMLSLASGTVGMYRMRMTQKTGCTTSAQLGAWAVHNGIVE
jgi:DNA-binding CsgD family transcriptional regulator